MPRGPIEVGVRRLTYGVGVVLSLVAFVVASLWIRSVGFFPPVVLLLALTLVGVVRFAHLLATGPYLFRIDERGIHDRSGLAQQAGRVAWDEIASVRVVVADGRPHVGIDLNEKGRAARSAFALTLMETRRRELGADYVIPPEAMGPETGEQHVALLRRFLESPVAREELRPG